jgi:hypothetical protein
MGNGGRASGRTARRNRASGFVTCGSIQVELVTAAASMHQDPFSGPAHGDRDRFHERTAVGIPIAGRVVVDVAAPETVRAMVAVSGADGSQRHVEMTMAAPERA